MKNVSFVRLLFIMLLACSAFKLQATEKPTLRLGVLAFGTTNWELAALKEQQLLNDAPFSLDIHKLANPQAAKVALQAGAVDMIVTDWIWVSRMRDKGADYTFYPYSDVSGSLMVPANSDIKSLADLANKRLGIAGDELDKNWLLLQALAHQQKIDLNGSVKKSFGAPPLLNQQLLQNNLDALLNQWHFAARLEAKGYRQLLSGEQILQGLGITSPMPNLGYVFTTSFANANKSALQGFFKLTESARNKLCADDQAWQPIIPLLNADDKATQVLLRKRYCDSRVTPWGATEVAAAEKIYALLRSVSHSQLTGPEAHIHPGTFWAND